MTLDPYWPSKPVESDERKDRRRYYAEQRRLREEERDEPLNDFDMSAKIEGLLRRRR